MLELENRQLRVCVVGAGKRFLSGISYYTLHLTNMLAQSHQVSVILMRQLLPKVFYPGRKRVGTSLTQLEYDPAVSVFDGVDWYWLPSIFRSLAFLVQGRPNVIVFQWWSGTVLHSYLLLALIARLRSTKVVIEFHEVLDTAEAKLPLVQTYVRLFAPLLVRLAHGFVIHSEYDRDLLQKHYNLGKRPIALIPHGPYNHCSDQSANKEGIRSGGGRGQAPPLRSLPCEQSDRGEHGQGQAAAPTIEKPEPRSTPSTCCNLLFFGVIRPFKGLEDLILAFNALPENEISKYWLTIVGETWEGWMLPSELIAQSRYRDRITFVNRYVSDSEATQFFAEADAVVLPYHRSSASGPLHIAMSCGLPIVVTKVGGLIEAVAEYDGAILVAPQDTIALQHALVDVAKLCGRRYRDPHSWEHTAMCYDALFKSLKLSANSCAPLV